MAAEAVRVHNGGSANPNYGVAYMSEDGGKSWRLATESKPTATTSGSGDNHCAFGAHGVVLFATVIQDFTPEPEGPDDLDHPPGDHTRLVVQRSTDGGRTWSKWIQPPHAEGADRPFVVADDTGGKYDGRIYIVAQTGERSVENESQGLALTLWTSVDDGATFGRPLARLATNKGSSGFNPWNPVILSDGTLAWLYSDIAGRETAEGFKKPVPIKIVFSRNGGESLSKSYTVTEMVNYGYGPQTPYVLAADRSTGPFKDRLYVAWSETKDKHRQILLARSSDRGITWSKPILVSDDRERPAPEEGPRNTHPAIAVNRQGVVGVQWQDRRDNPKDEGYWVRFSASLDGGDTWLPSVRLSEEPNTHLQGERITTYALVREDPMGISAGESRIGATVREWDWTDGGDLAGLTADRNGCFHGAWIDNRTGIRQIWTATINVTGTAASNGGGDLAGLRDLSNEVTLEMLSTHYDEKNGLLSISARLKNHAEGTLRGPLKARVVRLESDLAIAKVDDADNKLTGTGAVWDFTPLLNSDELRPGESTEAKTLRFRLSDLRRLVQDPSNDRWKTSLVNFEAKVLGNLADGKP